MDFGLCDAVRYEDIVPFAEHDSLIPYQVGKGVVDTLSLQRLEASFNAMHLLMYLFQALRFRLYGKFPTKLPRQARWAFADAVKDKLLTAKLHSPQVSQVCCPPNRLIAVHLPIT